MMVVIMLVQMFSSQIPAGPDIATKLCSSGNDSRRRAEVLVDRSNDRAARVARIGLWRSHDTGSRLVLFWWHRCWSSAQTQTTRQLME